ncbi:uncharacterized protein FOMMEDRAFT_159866 [Fomitiporia mediterranea MF3/22]|uniref:uncharacterized protein n=1 Tax=Fomitiporia mediterranea (strain MF3/22) TaxID=694068 RepID=UPI0004408804|nr:uncharacterized protein FOMMEDRAFT_159866 [Fomitiporia mediterranea MF3/22]EJD00198.1 hypothetical protein FOMMEDRAFT_159866 [Fomitiporia mediterranea MF3/22]
MYEEFSIKQHAREAADLCQLLSIKCVAESSLTALLPIVNSVPVERRETRLIRFVARAQYCVQNNNPINYYEMNVPNAQYEYKDFVLLNSHMEDFVIPEYALLQASLVPGLHAMQKGLEPIEHLIVICRSALLAISEENYESEAARIARLFARDEEHSLQIVRTRTFCDAVGWSNIRG